MKFSQFLLKESVDDDVISAKGEFDLFLQDEDEDDSTILNKFADELSEKGIYLGKRTKESGEHYRTYKNVSFGKELQDGENLDWQKFVKIVDKLFNAYEKEVGIDGDFSVNGTDYNFNSREDVIYFDNQ